MPPPTPMSPPADPAIELAVALVIAELANAPYVEEVPTEIGGIEALERSTGTANIPVTPAVTRSNTFAQFLICFTAFLFTIPFYFQTRSDLNFFITNDSFTGSLQFIFCRDDSGSAIFIETLTD